MKDHSYRQWRRGVIFTIKIWTFRTLIWCKMCGIPSTDSENRKNSNIPSRKDAHGGSQLLGLFLFSAKNDWDKKLFFIFLDIDFYH